MPVQIVIAGLDPAIRQTKISLKRWMRGSSPRMTCCGLVLLFAATLSLGIVTSARAQLYPPGGINNQPVIPFPMAPPPPAPPPITVPQVPQMNSPPPFALQNTKPGIVTQDPPPAPVLKRQRRPSFSDRVARCLDDGAAWGLNPNQRAAYSRQCANQ